jgi:type IV secretion system protein VirB3
MSEPLETVRIFRFNRGHLFLGGERSLVLATATLSLILVVILQDKVAAITGVCLWGLLMPLYRYMARHDPVLSVVYSRYSQYQKFYPAHGMKLMEWDHAKSSHRSR